MPILIDGPAVLAMLSPKRYIINASLEYAGGGLPAMLGQERLISIRSLVSVDFSRQSLSCKDCIDS